MSMEEVPEKIRFLQPLFERASGLWLTRDVAAFGKAMAKDPRYAQGYLRLVRDDLADALIDYAEGGKDSGTDRPVKEHKLQRGAFVVYDSYLRLEKERQEPYSLRYFASHLQRLPKPTITEVPEALREIFELVVRYAKEDDSERLQFGRSASCDPQASKDLNTLADFFTPERVAIYRAWSKNRSMVDHSDVAAYYFTILLLDEVGLLRG